MMYFKELAYTTVGVGKFKIWSWGCSPKTNFFLSREPQFFLLKPSTDWLRCTNFIDSNLLYLKSTLSMSRWHISKVSLYSGPPMWLSGQEFTWQCRRVRFYPWFRKFPWRRKWQPIPVFLPGKSYGQRGLMGYHLRGLKKSRT